jgi:hypothetical protein
LTNDDEISQWAETTNYIDQTIENIDLYKAYIQGASKKTNSNQKEETDESI